VLFRFDVEAGVKKTCNLIAEAAEGGAKLIAFPELWIPGYPNFIWAYTPKVISEYYIKYYRNAVDIESPHMDRIRAAARKAKLMVVISIAERDRGTLYMAQIFIGPDGGILSHRRKFKPTHFERVLFGDSVSHHHHHGVWLAVTNNFARSLATALITSCKQTSGV
jgi:cyanide hydratase